MKKFLQERKRFIYLVSPALIGAAFLFLCFTNLNQSVSYPESYNLYQTRSDIASIWDSSISNAQQPPLYLLILKTWTHFIGHNVPTARALSAILGAAAIVFAFIWLKYKYGSTVAIVSSFMLAISPFFIHCGQEISPAALSIAIIFAATLFLQLAVDNGRKVWWIIYTLLIIAGMLTSYYSAFVWLAHLAYLAAIYRKKLFQQKFIYIYLLPIVMYIPWMFSSNYGSSVELSIPGVASIFTKALLYDQAANASNWLLIPFLFEIILLVILAIRFHQKTRMLTALVTAPIIAAILLSLPPLKTVLSSESIVCSMVVLNMLAGALLVLFARELFKKKRKKSKKIWLRHPEIKVTIASILVIIVPIIGVTSVYTKGNYDFESGKKPTAAVLFENVVTLDRNENLSIVTLSRDTYYELSAYESYHHDVHWLNRINLDEFLENRDAIWLTDVAPTSGTFNFSYEGWRVSMIANMKFDDAGEPYQILKLERE